MQVEMVAMAHHLQAVVAVVVQAQPVPEEMHQEQRPVPAPR
jgi:hypothetical protein